MSEISPTRPNLDHPAALLTLTVGVLAQHEASQESLWTNDIDAQSIRRDSASRLRSAIHAVDPAPRLPMSIVHEMTFSYEGMTPMERFVAEERRAVDLDGTRKEL